MSSVVETVLDSLAQCVGNRVSCRYGRGIVTRCWLGNGCIRYALKLDDGSEAHVDAAECIKCH